MSSRLATPGDAVVPRDHTHDVDDDHDQSLVLGDHVPPSPPGLLASASGPWRHAPGPAAGTDSAAAAAAAAARPLPGRGAAADSPSAGRPAPRVNNSRRGGGGKSPSSSPRPLPRLLVGNTAAVSPPGARASVRRASSAVRRKSTVALLATAVPGQPVSPEPPPAPDPRAGRTDCGGGAAGGHGGVGYRLGRRKVLAERRKRLADYSLVFAMFGVVSMMVETELTMADLYDKVCTAYILLARTSHLSLSPRC